MIAADAEGVELFPALRNGARIQLPDGSIAAAIAQLGERVLVFRRGRFEVLIVAGVRVDGGAS